MVQLPYQRCWELTAAGTTAAHLEDSHLEILSTHLIDVIVTKIAVQNRIILYGAWKNVIGAEGPIAETNMLGGRLTTSAPLTFDG